MLGLRIAGVAWACLALVVAAGCGSVEPDAVGTSTQALGSCNMDGDCPLPASHGTCVTAVCNNHACEYAMDMTA